MPFDQADFVVETKPAIEDAVLRGLIALRELHSDPARWCGDRTATNFPENSCIAEGADLVAGWTGPANDYDHVLASSIIGALTPHLPPSVGLIQFNERMGTTHEQLMAFYDRAIAARRAAIASGPA